MLPSDCLNPLVLARTENSIFFGSGIEVPADELNSPRTRSGNEVPAARIIVFIAENCLVHKHTLYKGCGMLFGVQPDHSLGHPVRIDLVSSGKAAR